jgi:hypothetical protein
VAFTLALRRSKTRARGVLEHTEPMTSRGRANRRERASIVGVASID